TMARNKLIKQAEKHRAARRDCRRSTSDRLGPAAVIDPGPDPSQAAADRELLLKVQGRLSPEERKIAERRALGESWAEVAAVLGDSADALRMGLTRARDRVSEELGLEV